MMTRTINRQAGVTLVELMISLLLGLLIAIGLATLFAQNKRSFYQNEDLARLMEDGRFALQELARDIGMAGFYAELSSPSWQVDANLNGAADCRAAAAVTTNWANPGLRVSNAPFTVSWTYAVFPRGLDGFTPEQASLAVANNATAATAAAEFPCLAGLANLQPGSDVVFTKRVAGASTDTALVGNRVYVARRGPATGVLALGATITVPTLEGEESVQVPAGTQYGDEVRIKRKGMPDVHRSYRHRDMVVRFMVKTPRKLSRKQKKLLEEYRQFLRGI